MKITIYDNNVTLEGPEEVLASLVKFFTYNEAERRCLQDLKIKSKGAIKRLDLKDVKHLKYLLGFCNLRGQQNWVEEQISILTTGRSTYERFYDKGDRSPLKLRGNKLSFKSGLLSLVVDRLRSMGVQEIDELVDNCSHRMCARTERDYTLNHGIKLYEHQAIILDSVCDYLQGEGVERFYRHILLDLATGFGKTYLIMSIIKNIENCRPLQLFCTKLLFNKAVLDNAKQGIEFSVVCDSLSKVKKLLKQAGYDYEPVLGITNNTIAMERTLLNRVKSGEITKQEVQYANTLIVDECDKMMHDGFFQLEKIGQFGVKIGLSGTPLSGETAEHRYLVLGTFGPIREQVTLAKSVELGATTPLYTQYLEHDCSDQITSSMSTTRKKNLLYRSDKRIKTLQDYLEILIAEKRETLVYCGYMKLADIQFLYEELRKRFGERVGLLTGEVDNGQAVIDAFLAGDIDILVCNRVVGTGIDIANIGACVNWVITKNEAELRQANLGRTCRHHPSLGYGLVVDIVDKGDYEMEYSATFRRLLFEDQGLTELA